jgi:hypothetical protein
MNKISPNQNADVEDFSRYEFKYLLPQNRRNDIEDEISHFMEFDGHIHEDLENAYIVRSLYFDNPEATNYYEKIDGLRTRKKYRIRTYGHEWSDDLPIYLEEKGRYKERTFKHRIQIKLEELPIFYDASRRFELLELYPGIPLIESFVFNTIRRLSNPVVLVDYLRRPFMSQYDMNFRVTFDSHLRAASTDQLFPDARSSWLASDAGYTIIEIKFFRRIPSWFHRILQAHNLQRLSISKFCRGMEVCGLAMNLE